MMSLHLGKRDEQVTVQDRVRQIEPFQLRLRTGERPVRNIIQIKIRKDVVKMRNRTEVSGSIRQIHRDPAVPRSFAIRTSAAPRDFTAWNVAQTRAGCVLIVVLGSNSTRFGLRTTRLSFT